MTLEMIRHSPWMRISGEAIVVDLRFEYLDGELEPQDEAHAGFEKVVIVAGSPAGQQAPESAPDALSNEQKEVQTFALEVLKDANSNAKKELGPDYSIDSVAVDEHGLRFRVHAIDYVNTRLIRLLFNMFETGRWFDKVNRFKELMRRDLARRSVPGPLLRFPERAMEVSVSWRPGRDIAIERLAPLQSDEELDGELWKAKTMASRYRLWKIVVLQRHFYCSRLH